MPICDLWLQVKRLAFGFSCRTSRHVFASPSEMWSSNLPDARGPPLTMYWMLRPFRMFATVLPTPKYRDSGQCRTRARPESKLTMQGLKPRLDQLKKISRVPRSAPGCASWSFPPSSKMSWISFSVGVSHSDLNHPNFLASEGQVAGSLITHQLRCARQSTVV